MVSHHLNLWDFYPQYFQDSNLNFVFQNEFDTKSPWFLLDGDNIVKYDENTPNGRVLFFSTKESLKIMSRAKSLGVD